MLAGKLSEQNKNSAASEYLKQPGWAPDVLASLNNFISSNGRSSPQYDETTYVVFDFDNTTSIFDVEEQLAIYQLQQMAFALSPEKLSAVLATNLSDLEVDLTHLGFGTGSYRAWLADIECAYRHLYEQYGPFSASGLDEEVAIIIRQDLWWWEFATKMRALYGLVLANESAKVAYPWITYWFSGFSEDELYQLAKAAFQKYSVEASAKVVWNSPAELPSQVGPVSYTWISGVQVTTNIKELYQVFHDNGIKVWICSASALDVIRAAVDFWDLHESVSGILAMTNQVVGGLLTHKYDLEKGCGYICLPEGKWQHDNLPMKSQPHGAGKVTAIENTLVKRYRHGPAAGFMDSGGDFNFCTEFQSLELVVCFNRGQDNLSDGASLIAALSYYQGAVLKYDLAKSSVAGDTLYLLQGRDENGLRTLLNSHFSKPLGASEQQCELGPKQQQLVEYFAENRLSTGQILDHFSLKKAANFIDNPLTFSYGFLDQYHGYHSR